MIACTRSAARYARASSETAASEAHCWQGTAARTARPGMGAEAAALFGRAVLLGLARLAATAALWRSALGRSIGTARSSSVGSTPRAIAAAIARTTARNAHLTV